MDELSVVACVKLESIGEVVEASLDFRFAFRIFQCIDVERIPVGFVVEKGGCIQCDQGYEIDMVFVQDLVESRAWILFAQDADEFGCSDPYQGVFVVQSVGRM